MPMYKALISSIVASILAATGAVQAANHPSCRPKLTVTGVQFSPMIPPILQRKWTATVMVDAARCMPNASGSFDLGMSRLKETGYEVDFRERFVWHAPVVTIGVDFWADEAVEHYWIENVTLCECAH
jgi:hypothetical protein